jgi:potassium efflux system protein
MIHDSVNTNRFIIACFFTLVLVLPMTPGSVASEAVLNAPYGASENIDYADLSHMVEQDIKAETNSNQSLKDQSKLVEAMEAGVKQALQRYEMQISTHERLLLDPETGINEMEKAQLEQQDALREIATHLAELHQKGEEFAHLLQETEEKMAVNETQLSDISKRPPKDVGGRGLMQQIEELKPILSTQRMILKQFQDAYTKRIQELEHTQQGMSALSDKYDREIKERKKKHLLKRRMGSPFAIGWKQIHEEVGRLTTQVALLLSPDFWAKGTKVVWTSGGYVLITLILLLGIIEFLLFRLRKFCIVCAGGPYWTQRAWSSAALEVFYRSLPLLGTTLFLYAYAEARQVFSAVPFIQVAIYILVIWLFSGWAKDFLAFWRGRQGSPLSERMVIRLRNLVSMTRAFAIAYVVVQSILGDASVILFLGRLAFELVLLVWCVSFSRVLQEPPIQGPRTHSPLFFRPRPILNGLSFVVCVAGLFLELAGYGQLALYWYTSWGRTLVVVLWATLLFFLLYEWHSFFATSARTDQNEAKVTARSFKWLLIRLAWVSWMIALVACLLLAWGAKQTVLLGLIQVVSRPLQVGSMRFSLLGFLYAFVILLFTRTAARFWRQILQTRILSDSGLEAGVQNSVTTIMVYLLWMFGILIALTALGLSTTSLTVAFGALGVGLGFGLQNIFNNFVSGLILLFERPVQVGDVVEVNGTWGEITKINVRATQVQTYDNASLIIPNSEFISKQVTNWSFKDLRLRRIITVGVAYGSDVELVRKTLLEVADNHPRIFKKPEPDVLFDDFGDSALIFRLRVWTTIDFFAYAPSDIRFEIDRLFRERGITIPFPQRDIHIRTVVDNAQVEVKGREGS